MTKILVGFFVLVIILVSNNMSLKIYTYIVIIDIYMYY